MKSLISLLLAITCTLTISAQISYEDRTGIKAAPNCKPSETYLKKKIKSQLAKEFKLDFPFIAVDFTSFKGQNGYEDTKNPGRFIYPYKIEMVVYLKRKITKEGKELTEYNTWEFDRVYEYATRRGRKCELYAAPASDPKLISSEIY